MEKEIIKNQILILENQIAIMNVLRYLPNTSAISYDILLQQTDKTLERKREAENAIKE